MYTFITSCVSASNGDDINEMKDMSIDLEKDEFIALAEQYDFKNDMLEMLGYLKWAEGDLSDAETKFKEDWSVSVSESRFQGIPALYITHSGIENVYVPSELANKYLANFEESDERNDKLVELAEDNEDLFYDGIKNENYKEEVYEFLNDNREALEEYNIPLTSLASDMGNYEPEFNDYLRQVESEYLTPLLTVAIVDTDEIKDFLTTRKSTTHTGYKVMPIQDGQLVAGADSRQSFELEKGSNIKMDGNGIYLALDKEYVMDYYSGLAEEEVLLTLEFDERDITTGNINDREPELSLKNAKILDIHHIVDGEIIENVAKESSKKIKKPKL